MKRPEAERAFRRLQGAMRLAHWRVALRWDAVVDGAYAECKPQHVYDVASVTVGPEAHELDDGQMLVTLAHELMHLHTRDLERAHELVVEGLPKSQRALAAQLLDDRVEALVDRLAHVVVDLGGGG